ncbi:MAG: valine--tRNA ligase [Clostridiales bacterium]|nr:valine--tRNA ligase [Clostridiales bacterium]
MLENKYDYKTAESKWQQYWQEKGVYKFDKQNTQKPIYSIDTPPPTVSGKIHIGHIFSYSQAEFVARYKRMRGYNVFYPFGFDDNGLPTELLVEKERGIKAYSLPREEFTNVCMDVVNKYVEEFKNLFIKIGNSADWSLCYHTVSPETQKTSQMSFLDLYKKNKVYYAEAPALWCTKCRTAIAQSELETKEIETTFNHLKFFVEGSNEFLEIATTRPEFLCACDCVFVNPNDQRYKRLVGKNVKVPLYDFYVPIMTDDKADMEKGTGAVMCCTFGDQTDTQWFKKYNLEYKVAIDDAGRMTERAGKYAGMKCKEARLAIIEDLKQADLLISQEPLTHQVSVHERCGTEMEINLKKQWFIKTLENKAEWRKKGDEITWYPAFMQARYNDWVENLMMDWCISRQKYFGVPFPVWYCKDCGEIIVAEEQDLPVNPLSSQPKCACPKCGGNNFEPETDIMDTWATSSVTPQINCKWKVDDEMYKRLMPMSLRPNAHDIIRTWDFYTIVKGFYHSQIKPWKNIMISGFVMAGQGEKISKSKNNAKSDPLQLVDMFSADVTRYWAASGSLGRDIIFGDEQFKNGQRLLNKLYNASKFVWQFVEGYTPKQIDLLPMDKWLLCKLNAMQDNFVKYFEKYEVGLAMGELESFFWNFCDNYVEIVKNRLYKPEIYGEHAKQSAQYVCYYALLEMLKMFAIYMPHVTEEIYQNTFIATEKEISIHKLQIGKIGDFEDKEILPMGDEVVALVSRIRQSKSEAKVSLKTEIENVNAGVKYIDFVKTCSDDIKAVMSVKELNIEKGDNVEIGKFILE